VAIPAAVPVSLGTIANVTSTGRLAQSSMSRSSPASSSGRSSIR
jgi:hypothetical protein